MKRKNSDCISTRALKRCSEVGRAILLFSAGVMVIGGGSNWAQSNPSTCTKTGPALLLTELRDLDNDGVGETPIVGAKLIGETIYYQATVFMQSATGQCAYDGGSICIDPPGPNGCTDVTPAAGIPLLCDNNATCNPDGVPMVDSLQLAYVVNPNDSDTSGLCTGQVRAVARYRNGTSHFGGGVFPVNADTPICNPVLFCGDGIVGNTPGETCDPPGTPAGPNGNTCRTNCTVCGDGVVDSGEQCDDGNTNDTDGCTATCQSGCDISVEKECVVPVPPASPYTCTKPITSLTMMWNGTGAFNKPIRVTGIAGVTPFDIDNIQVGDIVTVSGYNGSQGNDIFWNIFDAGTSSQIGQSSFHLSCSDSDMNTADDCGKTAGDNKGSTTCSPGLCVNQWIFEGMTGPAGSPALICPDVAEEVPDTLCDVSTTSYTCTKPIDSLSMTWTGAQTIRIRAWKGAVGSILLLDQDGITTGTTVVVTGYAGSGNDVFWQLFEAGNSLTPIGIGNSLSSFHLSCSDVDMNTADDCGKLEGDNKGFSGGYVNLWQFEGMSGAGKTLDCQNPNGSATLTYKYKVTNNTGNPVTGLTLTDAVTDSGGTFTVAIAGPFDLAANETRTFTAVDNIGEETTNIATASNGACSADSNEVTVTVNGGGGGQCATTIAPLELHDREVRLKLKNPGTKDLVIAKITISWPAANGFLDEVKREGDSINKGNFNPPSTVITTFEGDAGKRTIKHGDTDTLKFKFQNNAVAGSYSITVEFTNGCSVTFP